MELSHMTPKQLGESGDSRAIPILHQYLQSGGIKERTHAASAIRKLSYSFKTECSKTINALLNCAAYGNMRQNAQLRQYSLLAIERLDFPANLEPWLRKRLEYESVDYVREIIFRILAALERKKVVESRATEIKQLNTILSQYSLSSFWHITHVDNLWSICRHGILNHSEAHAKKPNLEDISDPSVQRWRTRPDPIYHLPIHDYAALYINPKNPMLYKRRGLNSELCLVEICPSILLAQSYLFTDGNAASASTAFYSDYKQIAQLPWDVLNGDYWANESDGKRKRCAEVLILPRVWPVYIKSLHVYQLGEYHQDVVCSFPVIHSPNLFFN